MGNRFGYPKYVSVAEKKARAEKKIKQLMKKNPGLSPVKICGNTLAASWWGKAWNTNLEGYADFSNRIERGRSYVRHGAVLDLKIESGNISALVQGSYAAPYQVKITIKPLKKAVWEKIIDQCKGKIDSLDALLNGALPQAMETILTQQGNGIFPSPKDIVFDCSCPDWAYMCKHVAATLYGVGARLDTDPSLFFLLRKANKEDLVSSVIRSEADQLLKKAKTRTSKRIIRDADLSSAFGINLDDSVPVIRAASPPKNKPVSSKIPQDVDSYETVIKLIRRRRVNGISFREIKENTGLSDLALRNIISRARRKEDIQNQGRGL
ncbi:MAG: hypothetical protein KJ668_13015, partial [Proteobacteria bacterium]|nr:hypothetical protein [Pseudomonadota bacterium]